MNLGTIPTSHDADIEAQTQFNHSETLRASTSHRDSSERGEQRSCTTPSSVNQASDPDMAGTSRSAPRVDIPPPHHDTLPPTDTQPEWKPWKADEPLLTKIPKSETTMEDWVKAMEASDNGMCKGWRDQIDTLIIFAGLFSATVTAFTVESYQWLEETPVNTLARLQLRDLLNATRDPAMDRLAPATFNVNSASVAINTLWFASLTLSLAAVVISILCKQWLYEYQRYDNVTTNEAFLIHGLRHRGLLAWRVPEIIACLPILLQTALVLFLVGILVLLWPLQTVVVSIITIIVGLTFLFLGITTALPSIQYIFPHFDTQCAYKSSQSWSFFFITAFWLFDFGEFTGWASFDQWEVTFIYNGTGSTLSRVYKLLCNSADAVLSIYSFLADTSLKPTVNGDLALLPDFFEQLDAAQWIIENVSNPANLNYKRSDKLQRIEQLKDCLASHTRHNRLKPRIENYYQPSLYAISPIQTNIDRAYHSTMQSTLSNFLQLIPHISHPALFNRFIEHWARSIGVVQAGERVRTPMAVYTSNSTDIQYDPEIARYLVGIHGHRLRAEQSYASYALPLLSEAYLNLMESYRRHKLNPPPVTLLKDIQEWVSRVPETDKARIVGDVLFCMAFKDDFPRRFCESHTSELEKQYLVSFARFFVTLYERGDSLAASAAQGSYENVRTNLTLACFRAYLEQNEAISGSMY